MPWSPVTKETFERILKEEFAALTPEAARVYEKHAVTPYEQRCLRSADTGIERGTVIEARQLQFAVRTQAVTHNEVRPSDRLASPAAQELMPQGWRTQQERRQRWRG
jgi:hypothetical protein